MFSPGLGLGFGVLRRGRSAPITPFAPSFQSPPVISGDVLEGSILTAIPGTVAGYPTPTRSYQWKADDSNVGTDSTSFDTTGQAGKVITVVETATNSEGFDSETSAPFGPVEAVETDPEQPTFITVNTNPSYTGADGDGSGMRDGLDNAADTVWGSADDTGGSITAILGSDQVITYLLLRPISSFDDWDAFYLNGATVSYRPAAGGSWTDVGTTSGAVNNEDLIFDMGEVTAGEVRLSRTGDWIALSEFQVRFDPLPGDLPPEDQASLREDGGYRLREDGGYELTENP
jgi:hypothetical protein